ncbi:MAG: DoxX family protein [Ktedonobacteraceae bacterium]
MKHALSDQQTSGKGRSALWEKPAMISTLRVMQGVLALFFLYGGLVKLVPPDSLPGAALGAWLLSPLPKLFVYFTGITEMLGGIGLILPMYLRILPILTPLAAIGLIIEMIGATIFIPFFYGFALAAIPVVTGLLLAFVAHGCWVRLKTVSSDGRRNFRNVSVR